MKLGYQLIEKLKFHIATLKPTEMNLLLYLVEKQDNATGRVIGVHHLDVCHATGMVKQSFYSALHGLDDKDIIKYERHNDGAYYTVIVKDNAFPTKESLTGGYVDLQKKIFHSEKFKKLKAHEKYLVLYFCKRTHEGRGSFCIKTKNLYRNLTKLLGVSKRVVRSYLHSIKKFFSIGIKSGKYYITYLHSVFKDKIEKTERLVRDEGFIRQIQKQLKIRNATDAEISETAKLIFQYGNIATQRHKNIVDEIYKVVKDIVAGVIQKKRYLPYKLINKMLKERLQEEGEEVKKSDFAKEYEKKSFESLQRELDEIKQRTSMA